MKVSEIQLLRLAAKKSLAQFTREFWHVVNPGQAMVWNWHVQEMCDLLQHAYERIFRGEDKEADQAHNVPPGTSKSTVHSVMTPAWALARMPSFCFIGASYAFPLALDLSRKCRDVVKSDLYRECFPEVQIRPDQDTKGYFMTTAGGFRLAVGSNGSIIGFHAHAIGIDDPLNPNMAASEAELFTINDWIKNTLFQRKKDPRVTFTHLVMQRLHQDDPTAQMLSGGKVRHLCLPANLEFPVAPPELAAKYVGGLLDPARLSEEVLAEKRAANALGEYGFAGQYGQCLVAGTLVTTARGNVPIEHVRDWDHVLTRSGYRRVTWSGEAGRHTTLCSLLLADGRSVQGTPDHPVWTENRGWVSIDSIKGRDYTLSLWEDQNCRQPKPSHLTGTLTSGNGGKGISVTAESGGTDSTATCGVTTTATSPLAATSITRTKTRATIRLTIWSASLNGTTACAMRIGLKSVADFLRKSARSAGLGINRRLASNTTEVTAARLFKSSGVQPRAEYTFAVPAVRNSGHGHGHGQGSATVPQSARRDSASVGMTGCAGSATPRSPRGKAVQPAAPARAPINFGVPVYDLTVNGAHEFFANGVLVHNCPVPAGGGMFKTDKIRWGPRPASFKRTVRFWDKAATPNKRRAAWTVGLKMAEDFDGGVWVLDVRRGRWDSAERERVIHRTAVMDGKGVVVAVEEEPGSGGKDSALATVRRLKGWRVVVCRATRAKELRADEFSVQVNNGNVFISRNFRTESGWAGWAKDFIDELKHWPFSTFLDQGDAAGGAFSVLARPVRRCGPLREKPDGGGQRPLPGVRSRALPR